MRNRIVIGTALAIGLAAATLGTARAQMYGYGMMGPGMMGPGMMQGQGYGMMGPGMMQGQGYGMMGPGMMGPWMMHGPGYGMMGPGMMYGQGGYGMGGPGWFRQQADLNISPDAARNYFERWIAIQGNTRLKVGEVKEKDADTLVVDIVTKDNSLVQRFLVNRHTGFYQPGEG